MNRISKSNNQPRVRSQALNTLTFTAAMAAIMLVLDLTGLGIMRITPTGVTILHIPVIIGALAKGWRSGLPLGFIFGGMSFYKALTQPSVFNMVFMNPLVSILPRLLIPLVVVWIARAIAYQNDYGKPWKTAVCAFCGTLTNTIGVLTMMGLLYGSVAAEVLGAAEQNLAWALVAYGAASGIPEGIVAALISVPVMKILGKMKQ